MLTLPPCDTCVMHLCVHFYFSDLVFSILFTLIGMHYLLYSALLLVLRSTFITPLLSSYYDSVFFFVTAPLALLLSDLIFLLHFDLMCFSPPAFTLLHSNPIWLFPQICLFRLALIAMSLICSTLIDMPMLRSDLFSCVILD